MHINKRFIRFRSSQEVMGMGGPSIGEMYADDVLIAKDVIVDNIVYDKVYNRLFFVVYHSPSRWRRDIYFTLDCLDFNDNKVYSSDTRFKMLYIKSKEGNIMEMYEAFHDGLPHTKFEFDMSKELFKEIASVDLG